MRMAWRGAGGVDVDIDVDIDHTSTHLPISDCAPTSTLLYSPTISGGGATLTAC